MNAREEILHRLHTTRRQSPAPPPWESRRSFPDPARQFADSLRAQGGEVYVEADLPAALTRLERIVRDIKAQCIVANQEPPVDQFNPTGLRPGIEWYIAEESGENWRQLCATADLGVSGAVAALAETGTVVLASGSGRSRLATLLPPVHVALVDRSLLTTDIFTWTANRERGWPANVVLVSGPSKTADIEQTLSVGVHGPKRFIVILFGG